MEIRGSRILVLGGWGLAGMAICREFLAREPSEIRIHSLRKKQAEEAVRDLRPLAGACRLTASGGDIFDLAGKRSRRERLAAQLAALGKEEERGFLLHEILEESRPQIVVDCVNSATAIAYRDLFRVSEQALASLDDGGASREEVEELLEALYIPRLIRHIQVLYRGMIAAQTQIYLKVGTSGTGGMGLNIPYTHSEERPSRVLLSKSAIAGAHSMLLFLMARTAGAPITKEIKPAAAIAWKRIAHGPIYRRGLPIHRVEAVPRPLGGSFSSYDPDAAQECDEILETVYIDTGENGIFSLEEFSALTTAEQMEFVTPEEIARLVAYEVEGRNTGHDVINALDNAVLGPTYRAGLLRHWALERMNDLEREHGGSRSVAFEMLGPPRITKLLFEAHLLRAEFGTMEAVRGAGPTEVCRRLHRLLREQPELANEAAAVGIPVLLNGGEMIRGPRVIAPAGLCREPVSPGKVEAWAHDGWVDLRPENCACWVSRFERIHVEIEDIPEQETSSRYLRNRHFWAEGSTIQPGKVVGWILSVEELGARVK